MAIEVVNAKQKVVNRKDTNMTLQEIERIGKAELKKQETLQKNAKEKRQNLLKKVEEIDKNLQKIEAEKKKIRVETRQKIVKFARENF